MALSPTLRSLRLKGLVQHAPPAQTRITAGFLSLKNRSYRRCLNSNATISPLDPSPAGINVSPFLNRLSFTQKRVIIEIAARKMEGGGWAIKVNGTRQIPQRRDGRRRRRKEETKLRSIRGCISGVRRAFQFSDPDRENGKVCFPSLFPIYASGNPARDREREKERGVKRKERKKEREEGRGGRERNGNDGELRASPLA